MQLKFTDWTFKYSDFTQRSRYCASFNTHTRPSSSFFQKRLNLMRTLKEDCPRVMSFESALVDDSDEFETVITVLRSDDVFFLQVSMGNTDSHSSSFASPAKSSCALRFSSRREEVPSARSWWRSSQGGSRSRGRSYPNQHASSWHYEHATRVGAKLGAGSPQRFVRGERAPGRSQFGYLDNGSGSNGSRGERTTLESGGSPKVLLSKDGSMRVEFTNARVGTMEPQGLAGLPATAATSAPVADASLRTSKGSSLSSDGSWYDSPWGGGGELADNVFVCGESGYTTYSSTRTEETATTSSGYNTFFSAQDSSLVFPAADTTEFTSTAGYNTCSSGRTEDSGIGDSVILPADLRDFSLVSPSTTSLDNVYSSHNTLPAFPTTPDASLQQQRAAVSSAALLDDVIQEEEGSGGGVEQLYSSLTLPCRRAEPVNAAAATGNNRKDFLKSRIRRISDWTGSLSRKKRRIQVRRQRISNVVK